MAFWTFLSCHNKGTNNNLASVPSKQQIAKVDTVGKEKFSYTIDYGKYIVDTFSGKRAKINYSSSKTAKRFRSTIRWSIDNFGTDFAGHYNLAMWGCGTDCLNGAITDLKTGRVYDIPPASLDYKFKQNSRLLVINPPDSLGYYDSCSYCEPELWLWNDNKKKFEKLN